MAKSKSLFPTNFHILFLCINVRFLEHSERYPSVNWQQAFRDHKMFASAKLDVWYYVYPKRCEREARSFRDCLLRAAAGMKFNISEPRL